MSEDAIAANRPSVEQPTRVRYGVASTLIVMSCLLYLDRFAVGIASEYIREDLRMTQTQMSWFISAFFWSYALSQVPAGWLSDRFGPRRMLTVYILAWSAFTGLLGFAKEVWLVLHLRLYMGAAQAGAFPVCGGLIRAWFPISQRGTASSIIALGGRAGGVLAPILTAWCIVWFMPSNRDNSLDVQKDVRPIALSLRFMPEALKQDRFQNVLNQILAKLSASEVDQIQQEGRRLKEASEQRAKLQKVEVASTISFQSNLADLARDWVPGMATKPNGSSYLPDVEAVSPDWAFILPNVIAEQIRNPGFVEMTDLSNVPLSRQGKSLLKRRLAGELTSERDLELLNRLVVEAVFPSEVRKIYGIGWRPTLMLYGAVGIAVALAFAWIVRDTPKNHPVCNHAERMFIDGGLTSESQPVQARDVSFPWVPVLTSLSLWGNSLMQLFTNIGWLFAVTWLPRYLDKVHGVPLGEQALMTAIPTAAGIVGMFCGGWWTDLAVKKAGLKWGRRLPVFSTRLLSAFGYGICFVLGTCCTPDPTTRWLPWAMVFGLSVMVMGVDLGVPAVWAYAQDVGGKYTASILGYANMWGNIGAAIAPLIYNFVLGETPTNHQWNLLFVVCGVAFILSGLCGFALDATKPISLESSKR